jgi:chemotaxis protein MotB
MAKEGGGEIRIVKKKGGGHGHHGGAWKVAYADFVTAMMAFFMVMWLIGMDAQTRAAIAAYFRDPVGFMEAVRKNEAIFTINDAVPPGGKNTPNMPRAAKDGKTALKKDRKTEKQELEEFKQYMERALSNIPELSRLKEYVKIEFVKEGLRIELLEGKEPVFFKSGSAEITPAARRLLGLIAQKVGKLDNRVVVEGHTDAQPYRWAASTRTGSCPPTARTRRGVCWRAQAYGRDRSPKCAATPTRACATPMTRSTSPIGACRC